MQVWQIKRSRERAASGKDILCQLQRKMLDSAVPLAAGRSRGEQREGNKGHTRRRLLSHRKEFSPRLEEHAGAMESI